MHELRILDFLGFKDVPIGRGLGRTMMLAGRQNFEPHCGTIRADPTSTEAQRSIDEIEGEALRRAGRSITGCIWEDCRLPDPADLVGVQGGLDEPVPEVNPALQTINEGLVKLARLIVIPEMLLSQYSDKSRSFMGLLTELGRAWMTVDERLYLWDFKGVRDVTLWAGAESSGPIIDVKLVQPKKGVFVEAIKWLLVIVTPVEIRLMGVQLDSGSGDLVLHDTELIFGSDQVNMLSVASSPEGRIFCGGQDGHIYELEYEAEEGWFTRRCRKVNRTGSVLSRLAPTFLRPSGQLLGGSPSAAVVALKYDTSREYLWSLTEGGQVSLFSTSQVANGWALVSAFAFFPEEIRRLYPSMTRVSIGDKLVDIHPVSGNESKRLYLVAVTISGLRLYYGPSSADRPSDLGLLGLRAPQPLNDLKGSGKSVKFNLTFLAASMANVHSSYQQVGLYAAAGALSDVEDILIVRSVKSNVSGTPGGTATGSGQLEASSEWRLEGKVWEISEAPIAAPSGLDSCSNWWDELVRSHLVLPRQLFCLTNAGIYVFEKERPVDTLARLLTASNGNADTEALQAFFGRHMPRDQAISIALVLATRPSGGDVAFWATNAIFKYAGEPGATPSGDFQPSSLHMGLFRFAARLVEPVWKRPVATLASGLDGLIGQLRALSKFLSVNAAFVHRHPKTGLPPRTLEAFQYEMESLKHLERLVSRTTELLLFLSVCQDYRLDMSLVVEADVDIELLVSSPLRGPAIIKELGSALVQQQLHLQASVESLCAVLRDRSPSFFSPTDVLVFEGTDALERALKHTSNKNIREQLLEESLRCFLPAAPSMSTDMLVSVLDRFREARFYRGVLVLGQSNQHIFERALACFNDLLTASSYSEEAAPIFAQALSSTNKDFLAALYDWLFAHSIAGAILLSAPSLNEESLLTYLELSSFDQDGTLKSRAHSEMYWKCLSKLGKPDASGRVLVRLSRSITSDASELPLEDRVQCLSMAIATIKSTTVGHEEAREAEELLEVSLVQLDLLQALLARQQSRRHEDSEATTALHCRLYDLTALFVEFSEPLDLPEVSLLIVHTAGHADPILVARLWQRILVQSHGQPVHLESIPSALQSLSAKLWPSQVAFPLPYLVDMLALLAFKSIDESDPEGESRMANWFAGIWRSTRIPGAQLRGHVEALIGEAASSFWTTADRKRFLRLLSTSLL